MSLAASAAVGVHIPLTGTRGQFGRSVLGRRSPMLTAYKLTDLVFAGLSPAHRCCNFRPRASAFRLQRQQLSVRTSCSAKSAAQQLPLQQPKLHPAAATIVAVWQRVLQQVATLLQKSAPRDLSKEASSDVSPTNLNWAGCPLQLTGDKVSYAAS